MAITKIHSIKSTVNKAIEYICNPDKTDGLIYISSFACSPETAALDFKYTLDHSGADSAADHSAENKAFHLIQAFAPGEVSFKEAHSIGKELADKILGGKYSYVLTTHIDKGHVHNHLIFCAVDNIDFNHYHDCRQSYRRIRSISDKLCEEHGLSVISPSEKRGMKYNEWAANTNDQSWKTQIKKDINQTIKTVSTYEEFLALMKAKGYEIEDSALDGNAKKYISFRPHGERYFIRGNAKTLGANYTREKIAKRIEQKRQQPKPYGNSKSSIRRLIDMYSDPKYMENNGLKKWATKENLKIAAQSFSLLAEKGIYDIDQLNAKIESFREQEKAIHASIVSLEKKSLALAEIIKYSEQYQDNKIYNDRYSESKDPDRYFRKYESRIILFSGAERILQKNGINPKKLNLSDLKKDYQKLLEDKKALSAQQRKIQSELKELALLKNNLEQYLTPPGPDIPEVSSQYRSHI